ncbi:MAG: NAD(P)/FAD-dependent oxidoreductase, partial [Mangrovicoccus sp.]
MSQTVSAQVMNSAAGADPVIVIGGGPVGLRAAECLHARGLPVLVLCGEAVGPYNRVKLTPLLAGDVQFGDIVLEPPKVPEGGPDFTIQHGLNAARIDREARQVITADGGVWRYSKLVLATGSAAHIPGIPGKDLPGVFTFRDSEDAARLIARSFSARKVVVIGGGLLGLEAARGMQRRGAHVTIVEHEGRLMPRQLDADAARNLTRRIEALGVTVRTGVSVAEILGTHRIDGVALRGGEVLDADTVIMCTGVRARVDLAQDCGLAFNRGIRVDDTMRTADPDIWAVGECAEHKELVYGLVGPGLEQAEVAAANIAGEAVIYEGSVAATKLKVLGAEVFSAGPVEILEEQRNTQNHVWTDGESYRRIFITRGRLSGALGSGYWEDVSRVQQAVNDGSLIYPWQVHRFRQTGRIWPEADDDVASMPASA